MTNGMTHCLHVLSAKLSKQLGKCVCSSHNVQPGSIQLHIQSTFTHIRFHCESVLIRAHLILTFTFSHLNECPKRTDLKKPTKADTYRNTIFVQACKWVDMYTFALLRPCSHCHRDSSTRALKMKKFSNENPYTITNGFM